MGIFFDRLRENTISSLRKNNHTSNGIDDVSKIIDSGKILKFVSPTSTRLSYSITKPKWQQVSEITKGVEEGKHKANEQLFQKEVPSSALQKIKYDPETQLLSVKFRGGHIMYNYFRVKADEVKEMLASPSIGQYFMKNIHDKHTANPGHRPEKNKQRNSDKATNYKTMTRDYKLIMKGHKLIG